MDITSLNNTLRFESEIFVGDYSEYSKDNPCCPYNGVMIANMPLQYIAFLHIHNPIHIPVLGVNFESNLDIFRHQDGSLISNCECMFISDKSCKKGWLLLVELKYWSGSKKRLRLNLKKAVSQLESSFLQLSNTKLFFDQREYRCAWVVSLPGHDELIPFSSFFANPDLLLDYKEKYDVDIFTDNQLTILSHEFIVAGAMDF